MSCDTNQVMSFQDYFDAICFWSAHPALDNVAYDIVDGQRNAKTTKTEATEPLLRIHT